MRFDAGSFVLGLVVGGIGMAVWGGTKLLQGLVQAEQQGIISVNKQRLEQYKAKHVITVS